MNELIKLLFRCKCYQVTSTIRIVDVNVRFSILSIVNFKCFVPDNGFVHLTQSPFNNLLWNLFSSDLMFSYRCLWNVSASFTSELKSRLLMSTLGSSFSIAFSLLIVPYSTVTSTTSSSFGSILVHLTFSEHQEWMMLLLPSPVSWF